jgi:2-phosphosulfolactate phosphatase
MTGQLQAAHRQLAHRVRFDWGPTGAAAIAEDADVAVVVDVLSFTTTLTVAVERGIIVLPFRWKDERAAAYAAERDATLAVGRFEARALPPGSGVSLSPAAMARVSGVARIVLPSPNGSAIAFGLADRGCEVVGACLRNRAAVARRLQERGGTVAVVAGGERWPDDSLRPCAEDLWGAGAVLSLLPDEDLSPEARLAADAFSAVQARLAAALHGCAGGRELADAGFAEDVDVAAEVDVSDVVPVLADGAFHDPSAT